MEWIAALPGVMSILLGRAVLMRPEPEMRWYGIGLVGVGAVLIYVAFT